MRHPTALAALSLVLALAAHVRAGEGSSEETITLEADGSGTYRLHFVTSEKDAAEVVKEHGEDKAAIQRAIDKNLHVVLAHCTGVAAWTDVKAELKGKVIEFHAVGWFEDLNKVGYELGGDSEKLTFDTTGDGLSVTWATRSDQSSIAEAAKNVFDEQRLDPRLALEEPLKEWAESLHGTRTIVLPAALAGAEGATEAKGRTVKSDVPKARAEAAAAKLLELASALQKKVIASELTKEKALSELLAQLAQSDGELRAKLVAKCKKVEADTAKFKAELAEKKKAFAASGLQEKLAAAKKELEDAAKEGSDKKAE